MKRALGSSLLTEEAEQGSTSQAGLGSDALSGYPTVSARPRALRLHQMFLCAGMAP